MDRWSPRSQSSRVEALWFIIPLGVVAGGLTTLAGVGGGLVATVVLAAVYGPHAALAITAPGLLLGNAHRLWLLRRWVAPAIATRVALASFAGALVGGWVAAALSPAVIHALLVVTVIAAVAREFRPTRALRPGLLIPGGVAVGAAAATTGGGGLILAPLLLATGLRGAAFVGTAASAGVAVHVGRMIAYGNTGMLSVEQLPAAVSLAVAIALGNLVANRLRPRLAPRAGHRLTWGTLALCLLLAFFGIVGSAL